MKKGLMITVILLILATCVIAEETKLIPRKTNFMGDNIHIIRVQELSEKLDGQIEYLDNKLLELQHRLDELDRIQSSMNKPVQVQTTGLATQFNTMNAEMRDIRNSINEIQQMKQEIKPAEPAPVQQQENPFVYILGFLAINAVLLAVMILTYMKKPKAKPVKTVHEYVARALDKDIDEHTIKQELLRKGWSTNDIETIFDEVK